MTCVSFCRSAMNFDLPPSLRGAVFAGFLSLLLMATAWAAPAPRGRTTLDIYFVDVEGGQATLFVTPQGQSLLIDTGWPGNNGRDADRIVAAAKSAGITKLDFVLITHYHQDHSGGAAQLAARIPMERSSIMEKTANTMTRQPSKSGGTIKCCWQRKIANG